MKNSYVIAILISLLGTPAFAFITKFAFKTNWECGLVDHYGSVSMAACISPQNKLQHVQDLVHEVVIIPNEKVIGILGAPTASQATPKNQRLALSWYLIKLLNYYNLKCTSMSLKRGSDFMVQTIPVSDNEYLCLDDTHHIYMYGKVRQYFSDDNYHQVERIYMGHKAITDKIDYNNALPTNLTAEWELFFDHMGFCFGKDDEYSKCIDKTGKPLLGTLPNLPTDQPTAPSKTPLPLKNGI